jgi:hypothetical protein
MQFAEKKLSHRGCIICTKGLPRSRFFQLCIFDEHPEVVEKVSFSVWKHLVRFLGDTPHQTAAVQPNRRSAKCLDMRVEPERANIALDRKLALRHDWLEEWM